MKRLAILTTAPIQYYAPVFQLIAQRSNIQLKVFYSGGEKLYNSYDRGFQKDISWDIPLLEGYDYEFLENTSKNPGTHHFLGIINPKINDTIQAFKPDALMIIGWSWYSHLRAIITMKKKIRIWFRGDSTLLSKKNLAHSIAKFALLSWVYNRIDKFFYVGTNNRSYFKKYGVSDNKLIFSPHAIDNERFSKKAAYPIHIRKTLNIPPAAIVILFAGKFEKIKDPGLLLDAFLDLRDRSDLHLLFIGNGELENCLQKRSSGLQNIHFMNFQNQSQMPEVYSTCDLFCLPSKSESWGLSVNEAMAAGKPVLVSDKVGCAIDLIQKDFNGDIFLSGNRKDLLTKLTSLIINKAQLEKFGNRSKEIIGNWTFLNQVIAFENELNQNEAGHKSF